MFLVLLFPALLFLAAIVEALGNLQVPILSPQSLLFLAGMAAMGIVCAAPAAIVYTFQPFGKWNAAVLAACLSFSLVLAIDVTFHGHQLVSMLPGSNLLAIRILAVAVVFLVMTLVLWLLRSAAPKLLFVLGLAMFVTSLASNSGAMLPTSKVTTLDAVAGSLAPPVVYIVFDELMGPEAFDLGIPEGNTSYAALRDVFERHGFRLFGNAFSRHNVTAKAMPSVLNFDFNDNVSWGFRSKYYREVPNESVGENAMFARMQAQGRSIFVQQTAHLDYCHSAPDIACRTFDSFNPLGPYVPPLSSSRLAVVDLMSEAFNESYLVVRYTSLLRSMFSSFGEKPVHFDVYAFPKWFDAFRETVSGNFENGRFFFGHFLMPHAPYAHGPNCELRDRWYLPWFLTDRHGLTGAAMEAKRTELYPQYYDQVTCLTTKLDQLLTDLADDADFENATIVVHGDHGSRLSSTMFAETMSQRDMIDNYSALFAIRAPSVDPGYDMSHVSIQHLAAQFLSGIPATSLAPESGTVAMDSREEGKVITKKMPQLE